jgi:hypothetical protein
VSSLSSSLLIVGGGVSGAVVTGGGAETTGVGACGTGMAAAAKALVISALTRLRMSVWVTNALLAAGASALSERSVGLY